jgi:hypothetical protein
VPAKHRHHVTRIPFLAPQLTEPSDLVSQKSDAARVLELLAAIGKLPFVAAGRKFRYNPQPAVRLPRAKFTQ